MNSTVLKTIALVDISTQGHHLAFMRLFAKTLLDLQYRVIVIIPDSGKVDTWIKQNCKAHYVNFYALDYHTPDKKSTAFGNYNHTVDTFFLWKSTARHIKRAEQLFNCKINFVFFAWLDSFLANYLFPQLIYRVFPYAWSGLYFHPRHMRIKPETLKQKVGVSEIDIVLTTSRCKSVGIHDPGIASSFQRRLGKPVVVFPEIADDTPPDPTYSLASAIKHKAGGRTTIGMIGLEKRKGTMTLLRLAKRAPSDSYFFVFAGAIDYTTYSVEEAAELTDFFSSKPPHCLIHLQPIEEGAKFNAVFCSFDIPFIVYNDFASTSNLVTKAAFFKKYVLATERYIIGEDVKNYNLGITVEEGNVEQCLEAIQVLREKITSKAAFPASFEVYKEIQSLPRLADTFKEVLQK